MQPLARDQKKKEYLDTWHVDVDLARLTSSRSFFRNPSGFSARSYLEFLSTQYFQFENNVKWVSLCMDSP